MKICTSCKQNRPFLAFAKHSKNKDGLQNMCRVCSKQYRERNKEKLQAYDKEKYKKYQEHIKERVRNYREQNLDKVIACDTRYRKNNREKLRLYDVSRHRALKREVLNAYGHKCVCCGEDRFEFLTIDHINGGGGQHRKEVGSGQKFYKWLKAQGFPQAEFQVLCANCNSAKGWYGYCPHQS